LRKWSGQLRQHNGDDKVKTPYLPKIERGLIELENGENGAKSKKKVRKR
jgi:hypothetical protein